MSDSTLQQQQELDSRSQEMLVDPELLALDARVVEERAADVASQDERKLQALESLLRGVGQYLAVQNYGESTRPHVPSSSGVRPAPEGRRDRCGSKHSTDLAQGEEYIKSECRDSKLDLTRDEEADCNLDHTVPAVQGKRSDDSIMLSQKEDVNGEEIQFEMGDGEGKDNARSEYLVWLSKQRVS